MNALTNATQGLAQEDWFFFIALGILAILAGGWMAKKQARAFNTSANTDQALSKSPNSLHPPVNFFDYGDMRFLHLGTPAVQGSMRISQPIDIHLEYVKRMMGWLLFTDLDRVDQLHAMQFGLGAASLSKFCHLKLNMQTTVVELNPQVIEVCRAHFNLPPNNAKLNVVLDDAADVAASGEWRGQIDVLHVDLYDPEAARPVLDSDVFYNDCRHMLSNKGCMVVNVFGHLSNQSESLKNIAAAFGQHAIWAFQPTQSGNTVVLAFANQHPTDWSALQTQAKIIEGRWGLPAGKWLKKIAPI